MHIMVPFGTSQCAFAGVVQLNKAAFCRHFNLDYDSHTICLSDVSTEYYNSYVNDNSQGQIGLNIIIS